MMSPPTSGFQAAFIRRCYTDPRVLTGPRPGPRPMREARRHEMHQAGKPGDVDEDEFVVELTVVDGRRLQGFVLHRQSGHREPVTEWAELTEVINRMLAVNQNPAETE